MKKVIVIAFIFMLTFANSTFAHTGLESSNPENGSVITEELKTITLTFEGKLEQSSTLELKKTTGESIPVENISVNEAQLTGSLPNILENGSYEIVWSIVGADGHVIEGNIPFTVEMAAVETETPVEDEVVEETSTEEVTTTEQVKKTEEVQSSSNMFPVVIALIIIIGGVFFWLRRKK